MQSRANATAIISGIKRAIRERLLAKAWVGRYAYVTMNEPNRWTIYRDVRALYTMAASVLP